MTIQRIFQESFGEYERTHRLPKHALHAARRIRKCRTGELGLHTRSCPHGHYTESAPNSCRHRSCPQCRYLGAARWLEGVSRRVLPCAHFHVIFTIAHELNPLWALNGRIMTRIFFAAVRETLFEFLKDPKHLGALPGFIASYQSWGGSLYLHPHVHCVITAGGITPEGHWRPSSDFLLPVLAASIYFRGAFLDAVERAISNGEIVIPSELSSWPAIMRRIRRKKWNVYVQNRVSNPEHVLNYLARYIRGGPISNSRLVGATESTVTFRHTKDRNDKPMTLGRFEFIGRVLRHVPPPGLQLVRSYGLYANNHPPVSNVPSDSSRRSELRNGRAKAADSSQQEKATCCPRCGAALVLTAIHGPNSATFNIADCRGSPPSEVIYAVG